MEMRPQPGNDYLDRKPEYQFEPQGNSNISFKRICSTPKVLMLTVQRPRNESGVIEAALTMGPSIPIQDLGKGQWTPEIGAAGNSYNSMSGLDASECPADKPK